VCSPRWLVRFEAVWAPLSPMGKAQKGGGLFTPFREAQTKLPKYFFYITHASCNVGPHDPLPHGLNLVQKVQPHYV